MTGLTWQYVWINTVYNPGPALTTGRVAFSSGDSGWEAAGNPFSINLHANQNNGSPGVSEAIPLAGLTDSITLSDPLSGARVSGAVDAFADAGFSCFNTVFKPGYTSAGIIPANGAVLTVEWTNEPVVVPPPSTEGGCDPWPVVWPCDVATVDPDLLADAHSLAAQLLWSLSGYRIGVCTYRQAFRPAHLDVCGYPYKDANGNWQNGGPYRDGYGNWSGSEGQCCRVLLTHRPVEFVNEVIDGGVILTVDQYALEGSWLRRRGACWTTAFPCDDPELIVTYQAGVPFPLGTGAAVGEVACEYLAAMQGGVCRLPSRATSITRQGVTVTLDNAAPPGFTRRRGEVFTGGRRTGLPISDAWLETVSGSGPRVPSRVYSPDLARSFRV